MSMSLVDHPRLYVGEKQFERLGKGARGFPLTEAAETVARLAEQYCASTEIPVREEAHNALLGRARQMQTRVCTLLVRWHQTREERFRQAALAHLREMSTWEYWSWISMRQDDSRPEALFDLSYGENATTLALAWDWLHPTLGTAERDLILDMARTWVVAPFLENTAREKPPHWHRSPHSNWNTVCTGGAGMLALAMAEEIGADAEEMLDRADHSIQPYIETLGRTMGGWEEGVGYWNYGMRYAFMFLLSWERANSAVHPFMERPGVAETLDFPIDFSPYAIGCSFGDVNRWHPLPIHYAVAERFDRPDLPPQLDELLKARGVKNSAWADPAELLLLHPRRHAPAAACEVQKPYAKQYPSLDWCVLADQWPNPRLYLSVRGGTTEVAHGHTDLLSFHCVADGERLLTHAVAQEYTDMTFGPRRYDLHEMNPGATNTILVNGAGVQRPATLTTRLVKNGETRGVWMDATEAMGEMRDGPVAKFAGRLILLLNADLALVVDRVDLHRYGRIESRLHTPAETQLEEDAATILGDRARLTLRFAADQPAGLHYAVDPVSRPGPEYHMVRWATNRLVHTGTLATLISRREDAELHLSGSGDGQAHTIRVKTSEQEYALALGPVPQAGSWCSDRRRSS